MNNCISIKNRYDYEESLLDFEKYVYLLKLLLSKNFDSADFLENKDLIYSALFEFVFYLDGVCSNFDVYEHCLIKDNDLPDEEYLNTSGVCIR